MMLIQARLVILMGLLVSMYRWFGADSLRTESWPQCRGRKNRHVLVPQGVVSACRLFVQLLMPLASLLVFRVSLTKANPAQLWGCTPHTVRASLRSWATGPAARVSSGIGFGDQYAEHPGSWCVEVKPKPGKRQHHGHSNGKTQGHGMMSDPKMLSNKLEVWCRQRHSEWGKGAEGGKYCLGC